MKELYIACDAGIIHGRLTGEVWETAGEYPMPKVSALFAEGEYLYVLLREPFPMQSGVRVFRIAPDGALSPEGDIQPCHGAVAADILVSRGDIYTVNYLSGSLVKLPDRAALYSGSGPDKARQQSSHPHGLSLSPEGDILAAADLGTDRVYLHRPDLSLIGTLSLAPGSGPRQLRFSRDGERLFCLTELGNTLEVFSRENGIFVHTDSVSTLPASFSGESYAAALVLSADGRYLYASNRGHDSVAAFEISGGRLRPLSHVPSGGCWPAHLCLTGDTLLCANERGGGLSVFSLENGLPRDTGRRIKAEGARFVICPDRDFAY